MRKIVLTNYDLLWQNLQTLMTLTLTYSKSFSPSPVMRKEELACCTYGALLAQAQILFPTIVYMQNSGKVIVGLCLKGKYILVLFERYKIDNMI